MNKELEKLRKLSDDQLKKTLEDHYSEQFQDMIKLKTGQLNQSNKIKLHRKSIARIKTILNERDSGVSSNEN